MNEGRHVVGFRNEYRLFGFRNMSDFWLDKCRRGPKIRIHPKSSLAARLMLPLNCASERRLFYRWLLVSLADWG